MSTPGIHDDVDAPPRYAVGIDLGTTNCAIAFVDTQTTHESEESADYAGGWNVQHLKIPQWVDFGVRESADTLPSFHYQPTTAESESRSLDMGWTAEPVGTKTKRSAIESFCVGALARDSGRRNPGRRIQSAKSWLSHNGVDRSSAFLPWHGAADAVRLSPVEASSAYLDHLRRSWNDAHPSDPLESQDVVITLPASFDEVARELTVDAAKQAGLRKIQLIEEPQAAFYDWIQRQGEAWPEVVRQGDLILVCDIGGGTTDLTLIRVKPAKVSGGESNDGSDGTVQFHRVAVGKHLILGGDNLDLAIATLVETKLKTQDRIPEAGLSPAQWDRLIAISRDVKETMLGDTRPPTYTVSLPGEGAKLVGGALQIELSADEIDETIVEGFFPKVALDAVPATGASGFQEFGLPYAADPAITRHLAEFLTQHRHRGIDEGDDTASSHPNLVLFNGGVMAASRLQTRIVDCLTEWFSQGNANSAQAAAPEVLHPDRLDLAVARGAAYYGMVRRGEGVRIAANLGRSYYLQVQDDPAQGMALIPGNAEAGQMFTTGDHPLSLQVGVPVQFPLWVSSTRLTDAAGEIVAIDRQEMSPLPALRTALVGKRRGDERTTSVVLESELSEIGTVQIHCVETESRQRWKLDFDIRSTLETDREAHTGQGEAAGIVDEESAEAGATLIRSVFDDGATDEGSSLKPSQLVKKLQLVSGGNRKTWPPSLLRHFWQTLMDFESGRRQSEAHEARWLNLVGYCLRPGYGVAVDDWRVTETWRRVFGKLAFASAATKSEAMILWRRIAGGLSAGQQQQLAAPLLNVLIGKSIRLSNPEATEVWRVLASLEQITVADKLRLGDEASRMLGQAKHAKLHGVLLWSLGRLGSRQPAHGSLASVVPAKDAERWAGKVVAVMRNAVADDLRSAAPIALTQICRCTGDRFRDLSIETRDEASQFLRICDSGDHLIQMIEEGGSFDHEQASVIFGESLPLGIRLG